MNRNMISWFEIPASDLKRAKAFYESIFGFELGTLQVGDSHELATFPADPDSEYVSGGIMCGEGYTPSRDGSLIYLNADPDRQVSLDRVEAAGGEIVMPKRQISDEIGYMALIIDSEGNRIALFSRG